MVDEVERVGVLARNAGRIQRPGHREGWTAGVMLLPAVAGLTVFVWLPLAVVVFLSGTRWDLLTPAPQWAGAVNYVRLVHSAAFRAALGRTLLFAIGVLVVLLPVALGVAVMLNRKIRGRALYRTILFFPYVVPLVASGLAFSWLFNTPYGLISQVLRWCGLRAPNWLGSPHWALPTVMLLSLWQYLGFYVLVFLAGMQQVAPALLEAAQVEGAGEWAQFRHVTLPALGPTLQFAGVMIVIQTFQAFDQLYVMTGGGPADATTTLVYYIYEQGFQLFNVGQASAAAVVLALLLAGITWLQFRVMSRAAGWPGEPG